MSLQPHTPEFDAQAKEIIEQFDLRDRDDNHLDINFDYAYGETPCFDILTGDTVECARITKEQYDKFVLKLEQINHKRKGIEIFAQLSDSGGYDYWKSEGEEIFIIICAVITDIDAIDVEKLKEGLELAIDDVFYVTETYLP